MQLVIKMRNHIIASLISNMNFADKRFRNHTISDESNGGSFVNFFSPMKCCKYGFSITACTTSSSEHCRYSLISSAPMHLLQAGVNLVYIRDILGHVDISTTEVYARIDTEMKRLALEKVNPTPIPASVPSWAKDEDLMQWLKAYGRSCS